MITLFAFGPTTFQNPRVNDLEIEYSNTYARIDEFKSYDELTDRYKVLANQFAKGSRRESLILELFELRNLISTMTKSHYLTTKITLIDSHTMLIALQGVERSHPTSVIPLLEQLLSIGSDSTSLGPREDKPAKTRKLGRYHIEETFISADPRVPIEMKRLETRIKKLAPNDARLHFLQTLGSEKRGYDQLKVSYRGL